MVATHPDVALLSLLSPALSSGSSPTKTTCPFILSQGLLLGPPQKTRFCGLKSISISPSCCFEDLKPGLQPTQG